MHIASEWVAGTINGFPAKASSMLIRAFLIEGKERHKSINVSPARNDCKLSVFIL